jgi:hypothetical protein
MKHVLSSSPQRGAELRHFAAGIAIVGSIAAVGVLGSLHLLSPEELTLQEYLGAMQFCHGVPAARVSLDGRRHSHERE